jgi:prophage regulatory protein
LDTLSKQQNAAPKRLISLPEVMRKTASCRASVYKRVASGQFPRPVKIGRSTRWLEAEIDRWIDAAAHARDASQ